ncbi:PIG-L family deacetylase [bacterium]|nr:PIG-L family deacetylase [bacterium]
MFKNKRILLVAGHPDDIEIGCSGTILKYGKFNNTIYSIVFAPCLEDPLNAGILQEHENAMNILDVKKIIKHDFPRDILEQYSQQIRDILYKLKTTFNPNVIFCPSFNDLHQDHRAVASCCFTIFRDTATLLTYELVRSTVHFTPTLYIPLSDEEMRGKQKVLACYKTQERRTYFKPHIFESTAIYRGSQINQRYAEAFEILRMTDR